MSPFVPLEFETFNLTEYVPTVTYVYAGFCSLEVESSPNFHDQLVEVHEERSWKETTRGSPPDAWVCSKSRDWFQYRTASCVPSHQGCIRSDIVHIKYVNTHKYVR